MLTVLISQFLGPVLYCAIQEHKLRFGRKTKGVPGESQA